MTQWSHLSQTGTMRKTLKLMRQQLQDNLLSLKDTRQQIRDRIENRRLHWHHLISSLKSLVPNLISCIDLSLQLISSFNGRSYTPNPNSNLINDSKNRPFNPRRDPKLQSLAAKPPSYLPQQPRQSDSGKKPLDDDGDADPLSVVRSMVDVFLF